MKEDGVERDDTIESKKITTYPKSQENKIQVTTSTNMRSPHKVIWEEEEEEEEEEGEEGAPSTSKMVIEQTKPFQQKLSSLSPLSAQNHVEKRSLSTISTRDHEMRALWTSPLQERSSPRRPISQLSPSISPRTHWKTMGTTSSTNWLQKPTSSPTTSGRPKKIGTQIDERHQNFALMYDMLMGIRTTVSRCNARINRELTLEDFKARHKLAFDV
jgi:hypothetical protein